VRLFSNRSEQVHFSRIEILASLCTPPPAGSNALPRIMTTPNLLVFTSSRVLGISAERGNLHQNVVGMLSQFQ